MKVIQTEKAPKAIGPYSQAIEANGFVFASGQLGIDPASGEFVEGGVAAQTRQALTNARCVMQADFAEMNAVYAEFFSQPFPARSAVAVKTLPKNGLVEVECMAAR